MRPRSKINSICTVHGPMPRTAISCRVMSSSGSARRASQSGSCPATARVARSCSARNLLRDKPALRNCASCAARTLLGLKELAGNSSLTRLNIVAAALVDSCCETIALARPSNTVGAIGRAPRVNAPTARNKARSFGSVLPSAASAAGTSPGSKKN